MKIKLTLTVLAIFTIHSCKTKPDLETEKKALMVLHSKQKQANFEKNADMLLENNSADFIEINRGEIISPRKNESKKRFRSYFDAVDFVKWDDITPPVFSFSDDITIATAAVNKLVVVKLKQENNKLDTAYFAWLAVYRKTNGKWEVHRIVSTNK